MTEEKTKLQEIKEYVKQSGNIFKLRFLLKDDTPTVTGLLGFGISKDITLGIYGDYNIGQSPEIGAEVSIKF